LNRLEHAGKDSGCFSSVLYFYQQMHKFAVLVVFVYIFSAIHAIFGVFALLDLYN